MARPTKRTPEIESKLEHAFALGSTVSGACFFAGIGESAYYDWAAKDPEFSERMSALKQKPVLKALQSIDDSLTDPKIAMWYLERKHPDFKSKQDIDHKVTTLEVAGDILYKK